MRGKLTPEQRVEIVALREKGWGIERIAKKMGCSVGAVQWHCLIACADPPTLVKNPCFAKPPKPKTYMRGGVLVRQFTPEEDAKMLELEKRGLGPTAIGRLMGRKWNTIKGRLATLARIEERKVARAEYEARQRRRSAA